MDEALVPVVMAGVTGGVTLLGAYGAYWWGRSARLVADRIQALTVTPVSRVAPGFVEVKGKAKAAGSLLRGPMTGTPCIYYRFLVEELVKQGKSSSWRTRIDDQQECGLLVEDGWQGTIAVNVRAAELILKPDLHTKSGFLNDAPAELEAVLKRYGGSSQGLIFNKTLRYTETLLEPGDEIHVLGTAVMQGGKLVIDREDDLFVVSDQPEEQLVRSFGLKKIRRYVLAGFLVLVGAGLLSLGAAMHRQIVSG